MELNKIEEKDNGRYMVHLSINGRCESRRNRNCLPLQNCSHELDENLGIDSIVRSETKRLLFCLLYENVEVWHV